MLAVQYGNIAGIVKSFTEPLDENSNPKRYILWAREQAPDSDEVDILYYDWVSMDWQPVVGVSVLSALGDTDITALAVNNFLQWNGSDWENRANAIIAGTLEVNGITTLNANLEIGNLTINQGTDSINLAAASTFSIRNNAEATLFTISEATGNVEVVSGNLTMATGNIVAGNLSIESASSSIDLGSASTLSIRDSSNTILISVDEVNGNLIVTEGQLRAFGSGFQVSGTSDFLDDVNMNNNAITGAASFESLSLGGDPTPANIPAGHFQVVRNTVAGETRVWYNNAGTMESGPVFT